MKVQRSRNNDTADRLTRIIEKRSSGWALLCGILLADFGLLLIAFAGVDARKASLQTFLYSGGGILCFVGLALIWIGTSKLAIGGPQSAGNRFMAAELIPFVQVPPSHEGQAWGQSAQRTVSVMPHQGLFEISNNRQKK
jgi:hypothetical protein